MDARDELRQLLAQAQRYLPPEYKTVSGVADSYYIALTKFCTQAWRGEMDKVDFQRAHRALLKQSAEEVYIEGLKEGGYESEGEARANMEDSDWAAIDAFYKDQSQYVNAFAKDVTSATREMQAGIFSRCETWAASLAALGAIARAAAQKNRMGTWRLGKTEEHCDTCAKLNGTRHRVRWYTERGYIPRQPGNEMLKCGGWNCDCKVIADNGDLLL